MKKNNFAHQVFQIFVREGNNMYVVKQTKIRRVFIHSFIRNKKKRDTMYWKVQLSRSDIFRKKEINLPSFQDNRNVKL